MSRPEKTLPILPDFPGLFCLLIFLSLVLFAGRHALLDGDTLLHIKAGLIMLREGRILTTDIFSHTAFGKPWVAHEWLAEIIMGKLYALTGLPGVVIFYFLLISGTFWMLLRIANDRLNEWFSFLCIFPAFVLSYSHLLARPHIFTWFLGTISLWILLKGGTKLYILPFVMILWANLHGGFVIGLVLQAIFIVGNILEHGPEGSSNKIQSILNDYKTPLIVFFLSVIATGINPFGYKLLLFPFSLTKNVFANGISEWLAPNLKGMWYFRFYILCFIGLLLFRKKRISWSSILLLFFFLNESFTYVRFVSLAGILLTPVLAETLHPWSESFSKRLSVSRLGKKQLRLSPASGPAATVVICSVLLLVGMPGMPFGKIVSKEMFSLPKYYSPGLVRFIDKHPPKGNMFNDYSLGSYFIYALDPPRPVFIDGRADMYGEKIFKDYENIAYLKAKPDELLKKYKIGWVVFPPDKPLVLYLKAEGTWKEVYRDKQDCILVPRAAGNKSNSS